MSNYDRPGPLDGAIDDAVREMMQLDPRPGLRHRVAGAIGARPPHEGGFRVGLAWAAALAVVGLASVLLLRSPEPAAPVTPPQVAAAPPAAVPALPAAGPQAIEAPPPAPRAAVGQREPAPESIFGPRADRVAAASVRDATGVPEPADSRASAAPALPRVPAPGLAPLAPIRVSPIELSPLAIEPLTVGALPHPK